MADPKLMMVELIKYLPDNSSKSLINKYKKTSKIVLYPSDGTHGISLEVRTYKAKLGTISKVYKFKCMCCLTRKQSFSICHTFDKTDKVGMFEASDVLMPIRVFKTIFDSIYKEGQLHEKS